MSCKLEGPGCDFYACDSLQKLRLGVVTGGYLESQEDLVKSVDDLYNPTYPNF